MEQLTGKIEENKKKRKKLFSLVRIFADNEKVWFLFRTWLEKKLIER